MQKKISVIVPCYNSKPYLDRCLGSLAAQTIGMENLSIICVDNASADGTWQKLTDWKMRFPNDITLIRCAKNERQGTARNLALSRVTTPYVGFLDSDDWLEPDMYEKMHQNAAACNCDIVFCGMYRGSVKIPGVCPQQMQIPCLLSIDTVIDRKNFILGNFIKYSCCDKLIRTGFLRDNQISFPENLAYEDIYWGCMLYLYAKAVFIMEDAFYHYCIRPDSTVLAVNQPYHRDILKINELRWEMYSARNVLPVYRRELEYDYLISGYFLALKILALRFTADTWPDYLLLREQTLAQIPDYASNPYIPLLSEFQRLQLKMLDTPLSQEEWKEYCSLIKTNPAMK